MASNRSLRRHLTCIVESRLRAAFLLVTREAATSVCGTFRSSQADERMAAVEVRADALL
jgi:hypothetical protein